MFIFHLLMRFTTKPLQGSILPFFLGLTLHKLIKLITFSTMHQESMTLSQDCFTYLLIMWNNSFYSFKTVTQTPCTAVWKCFNYFSTSPRAFTYYCNRWSWKALFFLADPQNMSKYGWSVLCIALSRKESNWRRNGSFSMGKSWVVSSFWWFSLLLITSFLFCPLLCLDSAHTLTYLKMISKTLEPGGVEQVGIKLLEEQEEKQG